MKLLYLRTFLSGVAAALLAAAWLANNGSLALAAAWTLVAAEAAGLTLVRAPLTRPIERALLGFSESMCGMAVSLLEPLALLAALAHVVFSVVASGISTVSTSLGKPLPNPSGEWLRRLAGAAANIALCFAIPSFAGLFGWKADPRELALVAAAVVTLTSLRTIADLAWQAKWTA